MPPFGATLTIGPDIISRNLASSLDFIPLRRAVPVRIGITMRRPRILLAATGLAGVGLIAAVLAAAGSAVAGPARFTAVSAVSAVSAAAVAPAHSLAAAKTHAVIHRNAWQHDTLASHSQQNWYRLRLTSRSEVYTLLGALPANYNLRLYDYDGKVLGTADRGALQSETLGRILKAGTYFVRVASTSGASASKSYALLVRVVPSSETVGVLTAHVGTSGDVVGDLVNVSSQTLVVAEMDVTFYDANGKLLRRYDHLSTFSSLWIPMVPGARAPFDALPANVPQSILNKATRVVVVPWWHSVTARSAPSLTVSAVKHTSHSRNGSTWADYTGRIYNGSSRTVPLATAVVEGRDNRGVLVGLAQDSQRVTTHATRSFSTTYWNWHPNLFFSVKGFETVDSVP
jgi:hypothetical protein